MQVTVQLFFLSQFLYSILCTRDSLIQASNLLRPLALCVPVMSNVGFIGFVQIIYQIYKPNGSMQLYEFIIIFGILMLLLSQLPSFHSLRHINLASLVFCLGFSLCVVGGSIYVGRYTQDLVNVLWSIWWTSFLLATSEVSREDNNLTLFLISNVYFSWQWVFLRLLSFRSFKTSTCKKLFCWGQFCI
jgi:hypothetical protein